MSRRLPIPFKFVTALALLILVAPSYFSSTSYGASINTTPAIVFVGNNPQSIVYDYLNHKMLVADSNYRNFHGYLVKINGFTNNVTGRIRFGWGSAPFALAYDPLNMKVFFSNSGDVTVLDAKSGKVIDNIVFYNQSSRISLIPVDVAYDSFNGNVYVTVEVLRHDTPLDQRIAVIDGGTDRILTWIELKTIMEASEPYQIAYDSKDSKLFVSNEFCDLSHCYLSVINTTSNTLAKVISFPSTTWPEALLYDQKNDEVYVSTDSDMSNYTNANVTVISGKTDRIVQTINLPGLADARGMAYDLFNDEIYRPTRSSATMRFANIFLFT